MILGAILAGGRSRRFGTDKALALWQGKPLIAHVQAVLALYVDEIVICGRPSASLRALADCPGPDMGPLGGLNAALGFARDAGFERVLSIGCDMPVVPPDMIGQLLDCKGAAFVEDQPVLGIWPADLCGALDRFLHEDVKHSIRGWAERARARGIKGAAMHNVNRPSDLDMLGGTDGGAG